MNARIFISFKVEDAKRDMDSLAIWLKALEEDEGDDCEQDYESVKTIHKLLDEIEERHGDGLVREMREQYDNQGGHET